MSGPFERYAQRRAGRRAAALEDAQRKVSGRGLERNAQAGGRRLALGFAGAEQGDEHAARLGGARQPLQLAVAGVMNPRQQCAAASRAQHLLRGPERVAPARRAHHGKICKVDARGGERGRIRQVRRRQPDHALARRGQRGERRHQDLQLADSFTGAENLGQRPARPAASGKLTVERAVSGRHDLGRTHERRAAPDGMPLQDVFESRHCTV